MKTIGLLGGMSWESTVGYYRLINEGVKRRLGGLHSAAIAMISVDFEPIEKMQQAGNWDAAGTALSDAARRIEAAGADCLLICTNTMHKVAPEIERAIRVPLLHIADATAEVLTEQSIHTVGLLGTAFTMEEAFYRGRLESRHGLDVLVPDARERKTVHNVIYEELCRGRVNPDSRSALVDIIDRLAGRGAEGIILGCTEIGMLIAQSDTRIKLFDTTRIHAEKAVKFAT